MMIRTIFWRVIKLKNLFNLFLPNFFGIFNDRIFLQEYPMCNQKTYFTGKGAIEIGKGCTFGYKPGGFHRHGSIEFQARYDNSKIIIRNNVFSNNNVFILCANLIDIGENVLIGQNVTIMDFEAHSINPLQRSQIGVIGSISIEKNVWIGNNVTILKNSIIGENSIVAAGAVVSGEFPANVILGGVPARIIKSI